MYSRFEIGLEMSHIIPTYPKSLNYTRIKINNAI